ncbi:MAG TPA: proline dehydrogenase family protein [Acidothermaceae bacterium]
MLRRMLLSAAESGRLRKAVVRAPLSRGVVRRFVAGENVDAALAATRQLVAQGLLATIDRLGEATTDADQARATADAYVELLGRVADAQLSAFAEVSLKLSSLGQALPRDGEQIALDQARRVCAAAAAAGTTVTLDMEDHTTTDKTLAALKELRIDFPDTGAVVQAYLRRTEADCRDLSGEGSRIRLCKGAYREPASVAFQDQADVDRSYVRCLRILMRGAGYPMVATHDPRLIAIAGAMALQAGRERGEYEYQLLYGVRPDEQRRLAAKGEKTRVYLPYGSEWYRYLMRRLAERPANVAFFLRAVASKG